MKTKQFRMRAYKGVVLPVPGNVISRGNNHVVLSFITINSLLVSPFNTII